MNLQYTTLENERWDNIAFKAYGSASLSDVLIKANPEVKITAVLPIGTVLNIPVQAETSALVASNLLPPWKTP